MSSTITTVFVALLVTVTLAAGCTEEPNPVGSRLLPDEDLLKIDTVTIRASLTSSEYRQPYTLFSSRIMVGRIEDTESWGLLRIAGIPDTLIGVNIRGAELRLRTNYHVGDSLAPFSMTVHEVLRHWQGDSLTYDSIAVAGFYRTTPMTSIVLSSLVDTADVVVPLDTAMVRRWLDTVRDTIPRNFGILLQPTNSRVIKGFAMSTAAVEAHRPELTVRYVRGASTTPDTVRLRGSSALYAARILTDAWRSDSTRVFIRNGIAYRGSIGFSIDSIPARASIHKAVLELTLDAQASRRNSYTVDSLYAYFVESGGPIESFYVLSEPEERNGSRLYRFQVTRFVQFWVRNTGIPKILVGGWSENYALDTFVLHGAASAEALRPRLVVTYSPIR